jgi:hypothetical protein
MPWPESLRPLLSRPDSRAAQALRWGLCGLRASLQAALDEDPDDPGGEQLRALLADLDPLLSAESATAPVVLSAGPEGPPAAAGPRLLPLARAVVEDGRFQAELRRSPLREDDDGAIWNDVQRLLLRVPAYLAAEWRPRSLRLAEQAGARADESATVALPLANNEVVFPGLSGEVCVTGLRSAAPTDPDPRLGPVPAGDVGLLGGVTAACLWLVDTDPGLFHCLRGVFRFGIAPLAGEQRDRYRAELLRLWERARAAGEGNAPERQRRKEALKAALDLDEAFHSLLHQPPAAADSCWGKLLARARQALFGLRERAVAAGCPAHLQLLGGDFAEINRLAPDSLEVDFGVPGEVSACLRVWARIDGEELRGRVLYRPPREGP